MSALRSLVVAFDAAAWESSANASQPSLGSLAMDALACERRLAKGVNLELERGRYDLCSRNIEDQAWLAFRGDKDSPPLRAHAVLADGFPAILDGFPELLSAPSRLGATFFPPALLPAALAALTSLARRCPHSLAAALGSRLELTERAVANEWGLIECAFLDHGVARRPATWPSAQEVEKAVEECAPVATAHPATDGSDTLQTAFAGRLREAVTSLKPADIAAMPHDAVTEALHAMVYVAPAEMRSGAQVWLAHADRSVAAAFPVAALPAAAPVAPEETTLVMNVALMSVRHLGLDALVDWCMFRNNEVSKSRSLAESDAFCHAQALTLLTELDGLGAVTLRLYHTGFVPAVVGFYRALVEHYLGAASGCSIVVRPLYYRGPREGFRDGSIWRPANDRGAMS